MTNPDHILTDDELLDLLKQQQLEGATDEHIQKLTDMEAKLIFTAEPLILPSTDAEKRLIKKLQKEFQTPAKFNWLFGGLGVATVVCVSLLLLQPKNQTTPLKIQLPKIETSAITLTNTDKPDELPKPKAQIFSGETLPDSPVIPSETIQEPLYIAPVIATASLPSSTPDVLPPDFSSHVLASDTHIDTLFAGVKKLEVNASFCDISLETVNGDLTYVKGDLNVNIKGIHSGKPDYRIAYEKTGSLLKVWVENKNKSMLIIGSNIVEGALKCSVPSYVDVTLLNTSGNIKAEGLKNSVCELKSGYGDIQASNISSRVNIQSSSGNISLTNISGEITSVASYGNQNLTSIKGNIKLTCSSGNITLNDQQGNATITSAYGDVEIHGMKGDLGIKVASGKVILEDMEGSNCLIQSGYGPVKVHHLITTLKIECQSGNIKLEEVSGNLTLISSYGDVDLENCKGKITARLTSGNFIGKNVTLIESFSIASTYGDVHVQLQNDLNELNFELASSYGNLSIEKDGKKSFSKNGKLLMGNGSISVKSSTTSGNQSFK